MANIKLPPNTLPDVLPKRQYRDSPPNDADPLCQAALAISDGFGYRHLDEHGAAALVALAQRVAFDPNATLERAGSVIPLLTYVVSQAPGQPWRSTDRPWPLALEDFGDHLLVPGAGDEPPELVDAEWLAATLVAAGADPWVDAGQEGVGMAAVHAMERGMLGLLKRFLAAPGAPPVSTLAAAQHEGRSWLYRACTKDKEQPLLAFFLDNGARPGPEETAPMLEGASPQGIREFALRGLLPTEKAQVRRLETAWRQRMREKGLTAEEMVEMSALLSGKHTENAEEDARPLRFTQELAQPWGESWREYARGAYAANTGADALLEQAVIPSGRLSGRWSGLAVKLAKRLRTAGNNGVPTFDLRTMVSWADDGTGRYAGCPPEGNEGLLKGAIGFEWRPGLGIDGLVALVLLGQGDRENEDALAEVRHAAAQLMGVADVEVWATAHVESAVAFTEALVSPTAQTAATTLAGVWHHALEHHHGWLESRPDLAKRLLQSLNGNFRLEALPRFSPKTGLPKWPPAMLGILTHIAPGAASPGFVLDQVPEHERWVALEIALMVERPEVLTAILKMKGLRHSEIQRMQTWAAATAAKLKSGNTALPEDVIRPLLAQVHHLTLAHAIAEPVLDTPSASSRRPRM